MDEPVDEFTRQPIGRFEWERILRRAIITPPSVKFLGLMMATYASADGSRVRPGQARLAAVMGTSISTVERGQRTMEKEGFLEMVVKGHSAGRGRSAGYASEYRLTIPSDLLERVPMLDPDEKHPSPMASDSDIHPAPVTDDSGSLAKGFGIDGEDSPVNPEETPVTGAETPVNLQETPVTRDGPPQHEHHHKDQNKKHQSGFLTLSDGHEQTPDLESERDRQLMALQTLIDSQKEAS